MPGLQSRLDPNGADEQANLERMTALVDELRARTAAVAERGAGGDGKSIARHRERGKLPVRERIDLLLDPGSAFLELSALAANGLYDDEAPGAAFLYISSAASGAISRNGVSGSRSISTRSRGSSLPRETCRSRAVSGPPRRTSASRDFNCSTASCTRRG